MGMNEKLQRWINWIQYDELIAGKTIIQRSYWDFMIIIKDRWLQLISRMLSV